MRCGSLESFTLKTFLPLNDLNFPVIFRVSFIFLIPATKTADGVDDRGGPLRARRLMQRSRKRNSVPNVSVLGL